MSGGKCFHDSSYQSTIKLNKVLFSNGIDKRFNAECTACKRVTEWKKTRYAAQVDAYLGCWLEEL